MFHMVKRNTLNDPTKLVQEGHGNKCQGSHPSTHEARSSGGVEGFQEAELVRSWTMFAEDVHNGPNTNVIFWNWGLHNVLLERPLSQNNVVNLINNIDIVHFPR